MDSTSFSEALAQLDLTAEAAAAVLDVTPRTIFNWKSGDTRVPGAVGLALQARIAEDSLLAPTLGGLLGDPNPDFTRASLAHFDHVAGMAEKLQQTANCLADQCGPATRHTSRAACAIHEASHCVVAQIEGRTVVTVRIDQRPEPRGWTGVVALSDDLAKADLTPALARSMGRQLIAGVIGEQLYIGPAPGASITEQTLFAVACESVAEITGEPVANVVAELLSQVRAQLEANVATLFTIAVRLENQGVVEGAELAQLLEAVHA